MEQEGGGGAREREWIGERRKSLKGGGPGGERIEGEGGRKLEVEGTSFHVIYRNNLAGFLYVEKLAPLLWESAY